MKSANDHKLMILCGGLTDSNVHIHPEALCLGETFLFSPCRFSGWARGLADGTSESYDGIHLLYLQLFLEKDHFTLPHTLCYAASRTCSVSFSFLDPFQTSIVLQVARCINCSLHCTSGSRVVFLQNITVVTIT